MKRLLVDTDIGTDVDDALALALAATTADAQLLGVTTVHADALLRARLATRLLQLAGRDDVQVVAGASRPLGLPIPESFHWHARLWGHEGVGILDAAEREPSSSARLDVIADDAAHYIIAAAQADPGGVTLVPIGPLTNVARALRLEPRLADWIGEVVMMGGMVDQDKAEWPPVLETNFNADPAAAEIVFASGMPLTIVPIEVTSQVYLTPAQRDLVRSWNHPLCTALVSLMEQMLESFATFSQDQQLSGDIFAGRTFMHDPLAIYVALGTRLVTTRRLHVQLEVHDGVLRTMPYPDRRPNVRVCVDVDGPGLVEYWLESIRQSVSA